MSKHETTPCKSCGAPIIWIVDQNGTKVLVNKTRVRVYGYDEGEWRFAEIAESGRLHHAALVYISHFLTCPQANQFSGGKR